MNPLQGVICLGPSPPLSKEETFEAINDQARPAADVARILDEAKVANILWGTMAMGLVGKWKMNVKVSDYLLHGPLYPITGSNVNSLGYGILGS